ncbi:hypothetical protein C8R48DRAFT_657658 [Suillus tomentosus]|nr:hypothetical protein C8R48DRAFT_657658 [Suillus tomentosus]
MSDSPNPPNGIIEILTIIIDAATLSKKVIDTLQEVVPGASDDLKEKFHWINCSLKNATQFHYSVVDTYFDSGRYWKAPGGDGPFTSTTFSCCNGDGAVTGVTGGTAFTLWLDSKHSFDFAVGWTDPILGSMKAGVVESAVAEDGYNAATREGGHIQSKNRYKGKDEKGVPTEFYIRISASPGKDPMSFVVQQVPVGDEKNDEDSTGEEIMAE